MLPAGGEADADKRVELKSGYALPHDEDVGAVIVGFDRNINYYKIQYAQVAHPNPNPSPSPNPHQVGAACAVELQSHCSATLHREARAP